MTGRRIEDPNVLIGLTPEALLGTLLSLQGADGAWKHLVLEAVEATRWPVSLRPHVVAALAREIDVLIETSDVGSLTIAVRSISLLGDETATVQSLNKLLASPSLGHQLIGLTGVRILYSVKTPKVVPVLLREHLSLLAERYLTRTTTIQEEAALLGTLGACASVNHPNLGAYAEQTRKLSPVFRAQLRFVLTYVRPFPFPAHIAQVLETIERA